MEVPIAVMSAFVFIDVKVFLRNIEVNAASSGPVEDQAGLALCDVLLLVLVVCHLVAEVRLHVKRVVEVLVRKHLVYLGALLAIPLEVLRQFPRTF